MGGPSAKGGVEVKRTESALGGLVGREDVMDRQREGTRQHCHPG